MIFGFSLLSLLLLVGLFAFLVAASEWEKSYGAFGSLAVAFALLWYFDIFNVVDWAQQDWLRTTYTAIGWIVLGVLYSFYRFDKRGDEAAEIWLSANAHRTFANEQARDDSIAMSVPKATECKNAIGNWIVLWPFSAAWYLTHNFWENFVKFAIRHLNGVYSYLANRHYERAKAKVKVAEQTPLAKLKAANEAEAAKRQLRDN